MTDCITQLALDFHCSLPVVVTCDAPKLSSDGGVLLLRQMDDRLGLSDWVASCLPDEREPDKTLHSRQEQVRQRLYQIALGYEDCNDADTLRHDPLLKTACDRLPNAEVGLSSQPTLSRLENAVNWRALKRLARRLEDEYVTSFTSPPEFVLLDLDTTDDETHGQQQFSFYHGYYRHHMYHPLLCFDGENGQLVSVLLRPGNVHASRGALPLLQRLIRKLKARFPKVQILVRADSGFCVPRLLDGLEDLNRELGDVGYLLGIAKNPVLLDLAAPARAAAKKRYADTGRKVRHFATCQYAAETWRQKRTVVVKAEHLEQGENPRFVVTNLAGFDPRLLYDAYCRRGQCENLIKDFKNALAADRLSCSTFLANSFRLLEHACAYRLMHALRTVAAAVRPELAHQQFDTLRLRLLKVGALVRQSARRIWVQLPKAFPWQRVFYEVAMRLNERCLNTS